MVSEFLKNFMIRLKNRVGYFCGGHCIYMYSIEYYVHTGSSTLSTYSIILRACDEVRRGAARARRGQQVENPGCACHLVGIS